ncbi:MAG: glycosyltransferase family 2 protein, partial [Sedimentisphaerales bacterium]|nr:glycosyltransferase family 2 protein [Sedimentisphaerales bacterium]
MQRKNNQRNTPCSIVIRAYNEEKHIERLLTGISQQSIAGAEIILVDSGSTDHTIEIARRFNVKIININPHEFSFGRALNLGIQHATTELIVIASAHVYPVYPDWLEKLLAPLEDPKFALAYGKQRGTDISKFSEQQIFIQWYPDQSITNQIHPFCNNANAAIRRSVWEKQPYDESLSGLEDLDWAKKALESGYRITYCAEAEIIHVHNETPMAVYHRYQREAMAYKHIFPHEHFNFWDFIRLFTVNVINDVHQAFKQHCLLQNVINILWFRWMQFWGTYQGYRCPGLLNWQLRKKFYYPPSYTIEKQENYRQVQPIEY